MADSTVRTASGRLVSIDVLRGFDMFWIIGGSALVRAVCQWIGSDFSLAVAAQTRHVAWDGFHFIDWVAPLFLFVTGVTFPFSHARQVENGNGKRQIVLRILKRAAILFLLGAVHAGFFTKLDIHWGSILGRIGIAWAIAAIGYTCLKGRVRWIGLSVAFLAYWLLLRFVHAPDFPDAPVLSAAGNISGYLDRLIFPKTYLAGGGLYLSQGMLATVLSVPVTVAVGMFSGDVLRRTEWSGDRRAGVLAVIGGGLMVGGLLLAAWGGPLAMPINKLLWSPSYQLLTIGLSMVALALFYWLIDVRHLWRHTSFFRIIGLNAIFVYVAQPILNVKGIASFFVGGIAAKCPAALSEVLLTAAYLLICWTLVYWLHRNKIYFKV